MTLVHARPDADDVAVGSDLATDRAPDARRRAYRSGAIVAATGTAVTLAIYFYIEHQQARGISPAALAMKDMGMSNMSRFWSFPFLQASGLAGLLFAWISMLLGLQQSAKHARWIRLSYRQIDRLHRQISLLVLALVLVHVLATAADSMGDTWRTILIPGTWAHIGNNSWPQAVWGYNLGIIALYTVAAVAPTFYIRRAIGTARWRFLHRFVLVFYIASIWHALILGLDIAYYHWLRPLIWLAQIPLLALLIRRLLQPARTTRRLPPGRRTTVQACRYTLLAAGMIAIIAVLGIVITGHSDFITTV